MRINSCEINECIQKLKWIGFIGEGSHVRIWNREMCSRRFTVSCAYSNVGRGERASLKTVTASEEVLRVSAEMAW